MPGDVAYTVFQRGSRLLSILNEEAHEFLACCLSALKDATLEITDDALAIAVASSAAVGVGLSVVMPREPHVVAIAVSYGWGASVCLSVVVVSCGVLMVIPLYAACVAEPSTQAVHPSCSPARSIAIGPVRPPPLAIGPARPSLLASELARAPLPTTGPCHVPDSPDTSGPVVRRRRPKGVAPPPGFVLLGPRRS